MNSVLVEWNQADEVTARDAMISCCGARRWAAAMVAQRPFKDIDQLSATADRTWATMDEADWLEAFACHPRIGERRAADATAQSAVWSQQEQSFVAAASTQAHAELAEKNALYEQRFGFTYIVCATGKSAEEMLSILKCRIGNDRAAEMREAAEQQRQIMQIRLGKWLAS